MWLLQWHALNLNTVWTPTITSENILMPPVTNLNYVQTKQWINSFCFPFLFHFKQTNMQTQNFFDQCTLNTYQVRLQELILNQEASRPGNHLKFTTPNVSQLHRHCPFCARCYHSVSPWEGWTWQGALIARAHSQRSRHYQSRATPSPTSRCQATWLCWQPRQRKGA